MKNLKINNIVKSLFLGLALISSISCERDLSADAVPATNAKTAEIFTESIIDMGTDFYFPYGGSKPSAWSIDSQTGYNSSNSMRFDVPNATDPLGSYAGAIFRVDGAGRDLSGYDALTFYAKASQGVNIGEFGFGEDFYPNLYITTIKNVAVGTNWTKYIIPIADASKLINERGMFRVSAGTQGTNGMAYTFWIDDLKFEKLGTISNGQASIMNASNVTENTFVGVKSSVKNAKVTFNMPNGINQDVFVNPAYMDFTSSNPAVATVDANGVVTSLSAGNTIITAKFKGVNVIGSLTINCAGVFVHAPTPTRPAANVISIYSNAYQNVPVNYTNGYWAPYQTTTSSDFTVNGDDILSYNAFNFVGIEFSAPTVNATTMTNLHLDVFIPNTFPSSANFKIKIADFGADGAFGGTGVNADVTSSVVTYFSNAFTTGTWKSIDIPLTSFSGLPNKAHIAQIILEAASMPNIYVDNIYFYN